MFSHVGTLVLEVLFPARCIGCQIRGTALCAGCRAELPYLPASVCRRCASLRSARGVCRGCRRLSPALSTLRVPFAYEGAARTAVLNLKFRSGRYLVPLMGEFLRRELELRPLHADVVVPVPLAPTRMRLRGYNQALLLAHQVASVVRGEVIMDALVREERPPQQSLAAAERLLNLQGAFRCPRPTQVHNHSIVLVDDVVTTGATLSACTDTLAEAGARRVSALAFARDL